MTDPFQTSQSLVQPDTKATRTLIDELLAEQSQLTAVEVFARAHDRHELKTPHYRSLLPITPPTPGQQYGFEVDLDKCFGCKACVGACHSLNGLDKHETWRSVGLLVGDAANDFRARRGAGAFQQHITTACHHCVDPACLNGCPVLAYDKDPLTGIVRHLDDQCIGCQYCVMKCPYEVPQYSKSRGIVRKCDMCHSRLAVGEAPACVQACPSSAIRISVVDQAELRNSYRQTKPADFLAAAPNPAITIPTTRFVSNRPMPAELFAGDHSVIRRSDSHLPLVMLLVLSQLSIGASIGALYVQPALPLQIAALVVGAIALAAGSFHLGQPLKAWRSFLGWRTSWFSREVIALGGFVGAAALTVFGNWVPMFQPFSKYIAAATVLAGLLGVTCSAMIYVDTQREFWNAPRTFVKFFGTTLLAAAATMLLLMAFTHATASQMTLPVSLLVSGTLIKLTFELQIFKHMVNEETAGQTPLNKTARLLTDELGTAMRLRMACGIAGGLVLPLILRLSSATTLAGLALAAFTLWLTGELLERYLFFTAVVTKKMPGGLTV